MQSTCRGMRGSKSYKLGGICQMVNTMKILVYISAGLYVVFLFFGQLRMTFFSPVCIYKP